MSQIYTSYSGILTTSLPGWHEDLASATNTAVMCHEGAVRTHAGLRTIEDWRCSEVILILEPVPVGLVALSAVSILSKLAPIVGMTDLVTTFVTQGFLVTPYIVSVPTEKVTRCMDR